MTISIHDSDHDQARAEAKPLSEKEETEVVTFINELISYHQDPDPEMSQLLQQFVYNYENMKDKITEER